MTKPSWNSAPAWANYLAMDKSGDWYWFELEPFENEYSFYWGASGRVELASAAQETHWAKSLEKRPIKQKKNQAVVASDVGNCEYLTVGKYYPITRWCSDSLFEITNDLGWVSVCRLKQCFHLDGNDWSLVTQNDTPQRVAEVIVSGVYPDIRVILFHADKDLADIVAEYGDVTPLLHTSGGGFRLAVDPRYSFEDVLGYMNSFA